MAIWRYTLNLGDVFHSNASFIDKRDRMVPRIRAVDPSSADLQEIADGLAAAADGDEWDDWWDQFYDWADEQRVWVRTR